MLRPEKIFLSLAALLLPTFLILLPPLQAPDEGYHFIRAYQVSEGKLFEEVVAGRPGATVPTSLVTLVSTFARLPLKPAAKTSAAEIWSFHRLPLNPDQSQFFGFEKILPHPSLPYLPQAAGIALGRGLGLSPLALLYLGRLANALAWLGLVFLAIRRNPLQPWLWVLLALTPMSLQQAASLSPDAATNGLAFLLLATVLRMVVDVEAKVTPSGWLTAGLMSLGLTLSKLAYVGHALLFALIPARRFGSKRRYALALLGVLAANFCLVFAVLHRGGMEDWPEWQAQRRALAAAPLDYLGLLAATWLKLGPRYLTQSIGWLGHLDTPLPDALTAAYGLVLLTVAVWERQPERSLPAAAKVGLAAIATVEIAVIWTGLFLAWNSPGAAWIHGGQGRYLIPILPLVLLGLYRRAVPGRPEPDPRLAWTVTGCVGMAGIASLVLILRRFYGI